MPRQARLIVENVVHHVVARGVNKQPIFRNGYDKNRYLRRAASLASELKVRIHGYCLMNNHVHFLLTPTTAVGLKKFFSRLHTWWAMFFNRKTGRCGHLFQSRYFSSPLGESHYWTALRYVELNAVRANLVKNPEDWHWSSARAHLNLPTRCLVELTPIISRITISPAEWKLMLRSDHSEHDQQFRRAHRCSRPCGSLEFIADLESRYGRRLSLVSRSRPAHLPL